MRIFISATNTDVGKTYSTLKLKEILSQRGFKVGVLKPIETGVENTPVDATTLFNTAKRYNQNLKKLNLKDI
jgi:dethiobiotin synthetase